MTRRTRVRGRYDPERAAVVAGLRGDPCPPDGNPFLHLEALHACSWLGGRSVNWDRIAGVFRSLSHPDRRAIVLARRSRRRALAMAEQRTAHLAHG